VGSWHAFLPVTLVNSWGSLAQVGSTSACGCLVRSTRQSVRQEATERLNLGCGSHGDLESCADLPCCAGSLLCGVDECLTFLKQYRHVPSVVAVVDAFHGRGQDPGWGEEQLGADEGLG